MRNADQILELQYHDMRAKILALAADLDRIERAPGGAAALAGPRLHALRTCLDIVLRHPTADRAERVQLILTDHTPPPTR